MQCHADILQCKILIVPDGVLRGSAMLGAVASGLYETLQIAMKHMSSNIINNREEGNNTLCMVEPNIYLESYYSRKFQVFSSMISHPLTC